MVQRIFFVIFLLCSLLFFVAISEREWKTARNGSGEARQNFVSEFFSYVPKYMCIHAIFFRMLGFFFFFYHDDVRLHYRYVWQQLCAHSKTIISGTISFDESNCISRYYIITHFVYFINLRADYTPQWPINWLSRDSVITKPIYVGLIAGIDATYRIIDTIAAEKLTQI